MRVLMRGWHVTVTPALRPAVSRLGQQGAKLLVFLSGSSNRVQVVRRLDGGGIEFIDPQPE